MVKNPLAIYWKRFLPIGFVLFLFILVSYLSGSRSLCFFKVYLGIPCPGCGMTRAFMSVLQGRYLEAFYWNPLWIWVTMLLPLYFLMVRFNKNDYKAQTHLAIVTLVLFVSVYIVRMAMFFPDTAPLDYDSHSILAQLISRLSKL